MVIKADDKEAKVKKQLNSENKKNCTETELKSFKKEDQLNVEM